MISDEQRKPDGGLGAWIETMEAMGSGGEDAELLCLLLELRRRRENESLRNQPVSQPYKLPDGWKLVPIIPTYEMMEAWENAGLELGEEWRAMVDAAPLPPTDSTT